MFPSAKVKEVGKSYYDITVTEHHHIFEGESILDYMDEGLTELIRQYLKEKNFAFNALFTSLNVAKVTMKEMGMEYSMSSFKSLMTNIYLVKRIFKASGYTPNRTLISKIFKDLSCLQRIAA